jgi:hypothetical protein
MGSMMDELGGAEISTSAADGDQPHDIMQPFYMLQYCQRQ